MGRGCELLKGLRFFRQLDNDAAAYKPNSHHTSQSTIAERNDHKRRYAIKNTRAVGQMCASCLSGNTTTTTQNPIDKLLSTLFNQDATATTMTTTIGSTTKSEQAIC